MLTLSPELQHRLSAPLKVGSFVLHSRVLQSPLSGVTDMVFRHLVRRFASRWSALCQADSQNHGS